MRQVLSALLRMDYVKKLAELEAKEAELTKKLEKAEAVGNEKLVLMYGGMIKANQEAQGHIFAKFPVAEPDDDRSWWRRAWDPIVKDPVYTGLPIVFSATASTFLTVRYYSIARHAYAPYTEKQLQWRRWVLFFDAKSTPNAQKVAFVGGLLAMVRNWPSKPPPKGWN